MDPLTVRILSNMNGLNDVVDSIARVCIAAASSVHTCSTADHVHSSALLLSESAIVAERCASLSSEMGSVEILV